jgi:hypothetical protein
VAGRERTVVTRTFGPTLPASRVLLLHRVHDLGEEELYLRRDRPTWVSLLDQVQAFVHRGEPELAVEKDIFSASISARAANSFIASRYLGDATSTISESLE